MCGRQARLRPCIAINEYLTHYCVVRSDLPIGVQAAQLIHAAGFSASPDLPEGTYAIALHCKSEMELRALSARLTAGCINHKLIIESDAPYSGQAMAIGIEPMNRRILKPYLSSYALVAQSDRASGVMTQKVEGLNPSERATHCGLVQSMRLWFRG